MTGISKGIIVFLLLKLLIICLSTCHVVKRKAPDGKLYVFSSRKGCESVQSQAPCTLSWKLNPVLAKTYKQSNEMVATRIKHLKLQGYSHGCIQALKNSLCSQVIPTCSPIDGTRDYGDVSKLRQDVYAICPSSFVNTLKREGHYQAYKRGKHPNSACVAPSKPIKGACPQPKFKMPLDFLEAYKKTSESIVQVYSDLKRLTYDNGERQYQDECVSQLEEISCSPLYCSANESQLLIKHDRDDCHKIIKDCFDEPFKRGAEHASLRNLVNYLRSQLQSKCDLYPKSSSALQTEPSAEVISKLASDPPRQPANTKQPSGQHQQKRRPTSTGNWPFACPIVLAAATFVSLYTLY